EPGAERAVVSDPYAVLGGWREMNEEEIRDAYHRRLSFDQPVTDAENARARQLSEAYEILTDPERRRSYDASRGAVQVDELRHAEPAPQTYDDDHRHRTLNPISRATRNLPRGWRITIDWIVTIVGAIAIVLAIKAWVVNPYRIPSSS